MINIALIGGGKEGTYILRAFSMLDELKINGVYDLNSKAPVIKYAE